MNREEKKNIIDSLSVKLKEGNSIYFTKIHGLDAVQTASLRRLCFERDVYLLVVKNRLLRKAMEVQKDKDFSDFFDLLKENTSLMISESSKAPAKIIKDFLDKNGTETPLLTRQVESNRCLGSDTPFGTANYPTMPHLSQRCLHLGYPID